MMTRKGFVAKIEQFSPQIGDENGSRRQKQAVLTQNWRRKRVSSSKKSVSHRKMVTRLGFVAKIEQFSPQIGDENRSRRQKQAVLTQNW